MLALNSCSAYRISDTSNAFTSSGVGLGAAEHVQEVGRVRQVLPGRDRLQPLAEAVVVGDRDRDLGQQALGLAQVGVVRVVGRVLVEVGQHADGRAQGVQRRRPLGQAP